MKKSDYVDGLQTYEEDTTCGLVHVILPKYIGQSTNQESDDVMNAQNCQDAFDCRVQLLQIGIEYNNARK